MKSVLFIGIMCTYALMSAQSGAPHPKFSNFIGDVYKMEIVETLTKKGITVKGLNEHYGDFVYDYPKIGEIDIPELKIPETFIKDGKFPGVDRSTQYAMVLDAKMTITTRACYEFSLNSDDGSILWIDEIKVVDNDGGHGMTMKKDSVVYDPGTYDVKVWYFQSLADRFGIILDGKIIGKAEVCPNAKAEEKVVALNFESTVFFDVASSKLKSEAEVELNKLVAEIKDKKVSSLTINGHTDSQGSEAFNLGLSEHRAESIAVALRALLTNEVEINTQGLGESQPIADNNTKDGRAKNRRVEIVMKYK